MEIFYGRIKIDEAYLESNTIPYQEFPGKVISINSHYINVAIETINFTHRYHVVLYAHPHVYRKITEKYKEGVVSHIFSGAFLIGVDSHGKATRFFVMEGCLKRFQYFVYEYKREIGEMPLKKRTINSSYSSDSTHSSRINSNDAFDSFEGNALYEQNL